LTLVHFNIEDLLTCKGSKKILANPYLDEPSSKHIFEGLLLLPLPSIQPNNPVEQIDKIIDDQIAST